MPFPNMRTDLAKVCASDATSYRECERSWIRLWDTDSPINLPKGSGALPNAEVAYARPPHTLGRTPNTSRKIADAPLSESLRAVHPSQNQPAAQLGRHSATAVFRPAASANRRPPGNSEPEAPGRVGMGRPKVPPVRVRLAIELRAPIGRGARSGATCAWVAREPVGRGPIGEPCELDWLHRRLAVA